MRSTRATQVTGRLLVAAGLIAPISLMSGGCVKESGIILIVQNQIPAFDSVTGMCAITATGNEAPRREGVLDLGVGSAARYVVYPVVESRLPPLAKMGEAEPNTVTLSSMRATIRPPVGYKFTWQGCGNSSEPSFGGTLDPGKSISAAVEAILPCQAQQILAEFKPGGLNPDLNERVFFTVELQALGTRGGDQITSDLFTFPIRVCIGCLQTGFQDLAQFNYPGLPGCAVAPRPNPHKGNPCNIAQDVGPLLCCLDDNSKAVCPSPDK